jgi:hypothetical protein
MAKIRLAMQYNLRHLMFAVTIVAVAAWSITLGITRARHNIEVSQSTYAARLVAQMCVEHMKTNGLAWPRNWEELHDDFGPCLARSGQTWTFADLRNRVGVDWNVNPKEDHFGTNSKPIVWVASDPTTTFHGLHPNEIISKYLATAVDSGE